MIPGLLTKRLTLCNPEKMGKAGRREVQGLACTVASGLLQAVKVKQDMAEVKICRPDTK